MPGTRQPIAQSVQNSELFVYVLKSVTKNMGDYNSVKIEIGIRLPFDPTQEDIDKATKAIEVATDIVDIRMEKEVLAILPAGEDMPDFINNLIAEK